jgi:LmbE family N-acetylglucosaminyl deacetylase
VGNGSTVILSPHCDDAVLSLGASISSWVEAGRGVRVVTVFANDPRSSLPLSHWDRRAGFTTSSEAAQARHREDVEALEGLGVASVRLPFPDSSNLYGPRDAAAIVERLQHETAGASEILVPGFPLIHADHRWLADLMADQKEFDARIRFYVEQPYAWWNRQTKFNRMKVIDRAQLGPRHFYRKARAVRSYTSQVPLLGGHRLFAGLLVNDTVGAGEGFKAAPESLRIAHVRRTAGDEVLVASGT